MPMFGIPNRQPEKEQPMVSSEETALRRTLDGQLGRIDSLLSRVPPVEVGTATELAEAGELAPIVHENAGAAPEAIDRLG